jgi:hypothetical protein
MRIIERKCRNERRHIMKEKEYELVAEFEENNCLYRVMQPKNDPTEEELDRYYASLVKIIYN